MQRFLFVHINNTLSQTNCDFVFIIAAPRSSRIIKDTFELRQLLLGADISGTDPWWLWPEVKFSTHSLVETAYALLVGFGPRTLAPRDTFEAAADRRFGAGSTALASTRRPHKVTGTNCKQNGQEKSQKCM